MIFGKTSRLHTRAIKSKDPDFESKGPSDIDYHGDVKPKSRLLSKCLKMIKINLSLTMM